MTKQQEIEWLDRAIAELGPHTYLGASFIDQRDAIAANIRNDYPAIELKHLYDEQMRLRAEFTLEEKAHTALTQKMQELKNQAVELEHKMRVLEGKSDTARRRLQQDALEILGNLRAYAGV